MSYALYPYLQLRSIIICLLITLMVTSCDIFPDTNGATTKEAVVSAYLQALERRDEQAILRLIPRTHIAEQEVHDKVAELGGYHLVDLKIDYRSDFGIYMATVSIRGIYAVNQEKRLFSDDIVLNNINNRWYLILGKDKNFMNSHTAPTSQVAPP